MHRLNARLRREYLFRKSLEGKEKEEYEKKRRIREALQEGKKLPTETRNEQKRLLNEIELENGKAPEESLDDEYRNSGQYEPKVMVTTSHDPSSRLIQFAKEVKLLIPESIRVNRGSMVVKEMVEAGRSKGFSDIVVLHETRGQPDGMIVCHLPYGPTAFFGIFNAVLRHDLGSRAEIGPMPGAAPHLILHNLSTQLGKRAATILKHLFPIPKPDTKRIMTFANSDDFISFRHHVYDGGGGGGVSLTEVGPRWEMRLYQIRLGTLDQSHAENEFVLRAYVRSSKRARLSEVEGGGRGRRGRAGGLGGGG